MKTTAQRIKKGACGFIILAAVISAGFFIGRAAGTWFMEGILLRQARFPLLLSKPVYQFYDIYTLIGSSNPFSRLSGYYSLVDANMVDAAFIKERYSQEQVPVIRRTLLWILGFSKDRSAVLRYYSSLYASGDEQMKRDLLDMMKRLDHAYYEEFIKTVGRARARAGSPRR